MPIHELEVPAMPDWMKGDPKDIVGRAPISLKNVLKNSLYYPASGFDGNPVKYLGGNIFSFVYADYRLSVASWRKELQDQGFRGYKKVAACRIRKEDLFPGQWPPALPADQVEEFDLHRYKRKARLRKRPSFWSIFERKSEFGADHGPKRLSVLYVRMEGVAGFISLYIDNGLSPKAIAIVQSGHALGGNWTNFADRKAVLPKLVLDNPAGQPEILLYGGLGPRRCYETPCWPEYQTHVCFLERPDGTIGVWRRTRRDSIEAGEV